jgi:hypothetical protein
MALTKRSAIEDTGVVCQPQALLFGDWVPWENTPHTLTWKTLVVLRDDEARHLSNRRYLRAGKTARHP